MKLFTMIDAIKNSLSKFLFFTIIYSFFTNEIKATSIPENEVATEWVGVDVITNDFDLIPEIKYATGLNAGMRMSYADVRLKQACDNVRGKFQNHTVNCRGILMSGPSSLYVVEVSRKKKEPYTKPLQCKETGRFSSDLIALVDRIKTQSKLHLMTEPELNGDEFINTDKYMDYKSAARHSLALTAHGILAFRFGELREGTQDCDGSHRADAVFLMNFSGKPVEATSIAASLIHDPDEGVRNNSLRLISDFSKFIGKDSSSKIADGACKNLEIENFLDRNKSLSAILALLNSNTISPHQLNNPCIDMIRKMEKSSTSDQIGKIAKHILAKIP